MKTLIAMGIALLMLVGCGIDKGKLEAGIKAETNKQLVGQGVLVTSVSCVKENDEYHFSCLVIGSDNSRVIFKASCDDGGGGSCVWRPE